MQQKMHCKDLRLASRLSELPKLKPDFVQKMKSLIVNWREKQPLRQIMFFQKDLEEAQLIQLHLITTSIMSLMIREMDNPIVPAWLAKSILYLCRKLNIKPSYSYIGNLASAEFGIGYNPFKPKISMISQRYVFTGKRGQAAFINTSVATSFLLQQINVKLFLLNDVKKSAVFQQIAKNYLKECHSLMDEIVRVSMELFLELDSHFFFYILRPHYKGFQGIQFQNCVQQDMKGLEGLCQWQVIQNKLFVSSRGGSGGNDPNWRVFDSLLGIDFDELFSKFGAKDEMNSLLFGMTATQRRVIQQAKYYSIRKLMKSKDLKLMYNRLLQQYAEFLTVHNQYIRKYILVHMGTQIKGLSGTSFKFLFQKPQYLLSLQLQ